VAVRKALRTATPFSVETPRRGVYAAATRMSV
jgi:hypothetical protein